MDKDTITRNVEGVIREFTQSSKPYGLQEKYRKQLNDRKVLDGQILGVSKYTIQQNTVYVVAVKRTYNYGSRRGGELTITYYISALNPETGKYSYVMPSYGITGTVMKGFVMYTAHFVQRLWERDHKTFPELLKDVGGDAMVLVEKSGDDEYETTWGTYRLFIKAEEGAWYVTTMVTDDMLYSNQLETKEVIASKTVAYNEEKKRVITAA